MKIVVTIEDQPNGSVKIVSDPTFETMAKMIQSGEESTSAMGYAINVFNTARGISKEAAKDGNQKIIMPKVKDIFK